MPLDPDQQIFLTAAQGFVGLRMYLEANEELENIDPFCRQLPEVLTVRLQIYWALEKWDLMQAVAKKLALEQPWDCDWIICWAHATSHVESVEAGRRILLMAAEHCPNVADLHYTLACYETRLGDVDQAKRRLKRCFEIAPEMRLKALDDPKLKGVWDLS
jgi:hypothetical protein